jgi:hypothetical protein
MYLKEIEKVLKKGKIKCPSLTRCTNCSYLVPDIKSLKKWSDEDHQPPDPKFFNHYNSEVGSVGTYLPTSKCSKHNFLLLTEVHFPFCC